MYKITVLAVALLGMFVVSCTETTGNGLVSPQEKNEEESGGDVDTSFQEKYAGIFVEALNKKLNGGSRAVVYAKANGGTVTMVADFALDGGLPVPLLWGLTFVVDKGVAGSLAVLDWDGTFVLDSGGILNMYTGGVFRADGVTVNGSVNMGDNGEFNTGNGTFVLGGGGILIMGRYGSLSIGSDNAEINGMLKMDTGGVFMADGVTVSGSVNMGDNGEFNTGNGGVTVNGSVNMDSNVKFNTGTGTFVLGSGGILNMGTDGSLSIGSDNAKINGILNMDTGGVFMADGVTVSGSVNMGSGGEFNTGDGNVKIDGSVNMDSGGEFNTGNGGVTVNGSVNMGDNGEFNTGNGTFVLGGGGILNMGTSGSLSTGSGNAEINGILNMGTGGVFMAGGVTINGSLSVGSNGIFNMDNDEVSLYGYMDLGTGLLQGDTNKNGRLTIYPDAVFQFTDSNGTPTELVGPNSVVLSVDSKLEIKGGFTSNDECSREFTIDGGSATVNLPGGSITAIFNNDSTATEKIILKNNANIIIDSGTLAILDAVTEHSIGSLSTFIDGANGGTIVCVSGALILGTESVLTTGTSAVWSNDVWNPLYPP